MFCIESKIVYVGAEKHHALLITSLRQIEDFSFTFNDAEDYASGEICTWSYNLALCKRIGKSIRLRIQRAIVRAQSVLLSFLQAWRFKRMITLMRFFRAALRHICGTAGA